MLGCLFSIYLLPATKIRGELGYEKIIDLCTFFRYSKRKGARLFSVGFLLLISCFCVKCCNIYLFVRRSRKKLEDGIDLKESSREIERIQITTEKRKNDIKVIKMILIIFLLFGLM